MNDPDGQHISGYDPALAGLLVAEAAELTRAIGYAAAHVVLIGGLVPSVLVPVLDPGVQPHVGTADLDLCLSLALVEGDTETYERMEAVLKSLGYIEGDATFRWRRPIGLKLTVELFCPAGAERPPGQAFRPKAGDNPTGKHNLGGRLSALALEAGALLTTDVESITQRVELPGGKGEFDATLRVTGPVAFLVAKVNALHGRDKNKDAYDIVWLIESWPGGPFAAAAAFAARPVYTQPEVAEALTQLAALFAHPASLGARSYARFLADGPAEEAQLERRAVGAIAEFMAALPTPTQ